MKILFIFPNVDSPGYKPVSISTLSAIAKKRGHEVRLYDTSFFDTDGYHSLQNFILNNKIGESIANFLPVNEEKYGLVKTKVDLREDFLKVLNDYRPELVLVSTLSMEYALSIFLLRLVKEFDKSIPTLMGGRHCYSDPEGTIADDCVDIICIGEGEKPLTELLDCLENKKDYSQAQGLWVKRGGKVIKNSSISYFFELDSLPYMDLDIYDKRQFFRIFHGKVYKSIDYVMKRGCFEQCGYCQSALVHKWHCGDKSVRSYSVDRAVAELKYLKEKYSMNFVRFHDETFLATPVDNLEYLADQYIKHVNLPFVADAAPQTVTREKAKILARMGCKSVSLGTESGSEEFRYKVLNKKVRNDAVINAFRYFSEAGIRTVMFNLIGFPFERREHIEESITLNRLCNVTAPSIGFFYPFKGCKLRDVAIDNGLFDPSIEVNGAAQWVRNRPFVSNANITYDEYLGIFRTFILYCKLPETMFPEIKKAERDDATFYKLRDLYAEKYLTMEKNCD